MGCQWSFGHQHPTILTYTLKKHYEHVIKKGFQVSTSIATFNNDPVPFYKSKGTNESEQRSFRYTHVEI